MELVILLLYLTGFDPMSGGGSRNGEEKGGVTD